MIAAPIGAIYVWCNSSFSYPRDLARKIGREDLEIVSPHWISLHKWAGRELAGLVIDHAASLTPIDWEVLPYIKSRIR